MKKTIKLWLDDIRVPEEHGRIGWLWVKSAEEAIEVLATGIVLKASLDHDLTISQTLGHDDNEPTGYSVVCWMEKHDMWPPEGVEVHSMNPTGADRMKSVIKKHYFKF